MRRARERRELARDFDWILEHPQVIAGVEAHAERRRIDGRQQLTQLIRQQVEVILDRQHHAVRSRLLGQRHQHLHQCALVFGP